MRATFTPRWILAGALALALTVGTVAFEPSALAKSWVILNGQAALQQNAKTSCIYPKNSIATLDAVGAQVGRPFTCALVFNTAAGTWAEWDSPWFTHNSNPDQNWSAWASADPSRLMIITQPMIPFGMPRNWASLGAAGAYDVYAQTLAQNLVKAGLGSSIIRIGAEANGTSTPDSLAAAGSPQDWKAYWARIVTTMRSVPGSNFQFDWTVNAGWQAIALDSYYPGDDAVDIIGIDNYDSSVSHTTYATAGARATAQYNQRSGLGEVIAYAQAHGKPLSIPEWALKQTTSWGAGDNPTYVDGIAAVVRDNNVRYQCYFLNTTGGVIPITQAPLSLITYGQHFGPAGDAVG